MLFKFFFNVAVLYWSATLAIKLICKPFNVRGLKGWWFTL